MSVSQPSLPDLPPALPGFEHVDRYWDRTHGSVAAKILPGEFYVTGHEELIVTVLGSCVAACIRDPKLRIGGMNHFMLPFGTTDDRWASGVVNKATRYGNFAMEHLINELIKQGATRRTLEVKLFGGAHVLEAAMDVGSRNTSFVREYCRTEGLNVLAEDLGGPWPRKVYFDPREGRVRLLKLRKVRNDTIVDRERRYERKLREDQVQGDIDLF